MPIILPYRSRRLLPPAFGGLKIDRAHPLAKDLVGCFLPGISNGVDIANYIGNLVPGPSAVDSISQEGPGSFGAEPAASFPGFSNSSLATAFATGWTGLTLYFRGSSRALGNGNTAPLIGIMPNNTDSSPFALASITDKTGLLTPEWNTNGTYTVGSTFSLPSPVGTEVQLSLMATFKVGGNVIQYSDGVSKTSNSFGAIGPTATTPVLTINGLPAQATRGSGKTVVMACVWLRDLSAGEAALMDADPYCFLMPSEGEMPSIFLSSGFTAKFRKTLSPIGARVGARQLQAG